MNRPLTQRELKQQKKNNQQQEYVIVVNKTKNQMVPIQLKAPPGVDWFAGEQTVQLYPHKMARFPKSRLYLEQIDNYQKAGRVSVIENA